MITWTQKLMFDANGVPMTIHKSHGHLSVECDSCADEMTTDEQYTFEEFHEFVKAIRAEGWRVSKVDDEWRHTCPDCEGEES